MLTSKKNNGSLENLSQHHWVMENQAREKMYNLTPNHLILQTSQAPQETTPLGLQEIIPLVLQSLALGMREVTMESKSGSTRTMISLELSKRSQLEQILMSRTCL